MAQISDIVIERRNSRTFQISGVPTALDEELCELISRRNGNMTPTQVLDALLKGQRVYTALNYYVRKAD